MNRLLPWACFCAILLVGLPIKAQTGMYAWAQSPDVPVPSSSPTKYLHVVLAAIEETHDISFLYDNDLKFELVNVQADGSVSLESLLQQLSSHVRIECKQMDKGFYVVTKRAVVSQSLNEEPRLNKVSSSSDPVYVRPTFPGNLQTITKSIRGRVVGSDNVAMPGVNVVVKNTTIGTVTDTQGMYTLDAPDDADVLVFSFIGYLPEEVVIGNQSEINVTLTEDIQQLQEVLVIGYGEVKKDDLTGSVGHIDEKELRSVVKTGIDQALQGRIAGVQVTNNSGQPGGGVSLRIRGVSSVNGTNEPLYVIDGVPMDGSATGTATGFEWAGGGNGQTAVSKLATINPDDIATIDVLKDASAQAIYGSRAANGVVIITTKRGKAGESKITYDGYAGTQQLGRTLDVLNLREYAAYVNAGYDAIGKTPKPLDLADPSVLGNGTDWQNELFQSAAIQNHQIGISGGNEKNTYAISGGYFNQQGVVIGTEFERYSMRINLDSKVKEWLKVGNSFSVSYSNQAMTLTDQDDGVVAISLTQSPDIPVKNIDGSWAGIVTDRSAYTNADNPVAKANDRNLNLKRYKAIGNFFADISFLQNFTLRTEIGGDIEFGNNYAFIPTYQYGLFSKNDVNQSRRDRNQSLYWIIKNYLTYDKTYAERHHLTALIGHEAQSWTSEYLYGLRQKFSSNNVQELNSGDALTARNGGGKSDWALESYFGRVMYSFADKYFFTGTIRADASSNFGPANKWAYTPSFAGRWRILNERLLSGLTNLFDDLSVRIGYGITGNQNIPSYQYGAAIYSGLNGFGSVSYIDKIANPDIRWETSEQFNVGIDARFINGRVEVVADYYIKNTDDALMQRSFPDYMGTNGTGGLSAPWVNLGRIENRGVELTVNSHNTVSSLEWNTALTISANRNKVIDLGEGVNPIDGYAQWTNLVTRTQAGRPIGMFYGYVVDGIFTSAEELESAPAQGKGEIDRVTGTWIGDYRFANINGDNVIDANDRTFIGDPNPKFTFGLNNSFAFKGIDLTVYLQGSYGNDVFNFLRSRTESMRFLRDNQGAAVLRRAELAMIDPGGDINDLSNWTVVNPDTDMPRQVAGDPNENSRMSSRYIEDGSYLRIQNVSLGYSLPPSTLPKFVQRLRVYANVQNLYTFTRYDGYDPEIGAFNQSALMTGVDNGRYPVPRTITAGLNVQF